MIVTVEDNVVKGGFGESLRCACGDEYKFMCFGWPDSFIEQGSFDELADKYGLTAKKMAERICEELERKA